MIHLTLTDNKPNINLSELDGDKTDFDNLHYFANIQVGELAAKYPDLLVFPHSFNSNPDKIEDNCIIRMSGNFDNAKISTGNIMGFIGYGDTQLTINSRFQQGKQDVFLHYMIQKVFLPNIVNWQHSTINGNVFDFLPFMFPFYLKKALTQGLYKTYQKYERNDSRVKGVINVNRHIKLNVPFMGNIAYTSRESSYDNQTTQLIRHTIEYIKNKVYGKNILSNSSEIQSFVRQIIEATPTYSVRQRQNVINNNLKPFQHPYYSEYRPLQKLCMAILNHKKLSYGNGSRKVYGILFDGAWLWEEYLATILNKCGFTHSENKTEKNPIYVYSDNSCVRYPDFYKRTSDNPEKNIVIDAKYKNIQSLSKIERNDLHQIITYMHILPAATARLVYPEKNGIVNNYNYIQGYGGKLGIMGFPVPQNKNDFKIFCEEMHGAENKFLDDIKMMLSNAPVS